ncbi:hypothetical protein GCM10009118_04100 [Wandonia haliotis]|uniref:Uncharacterized protein n=2 Tax=Wandonia haliotis TaxID=574963 RepID=A0ABN1ML96_9FLAO
MVNEQLKSIAGSTDAEKMDTWFNGLISSIEMDKFLMTEDLASDETKAFYKAVMSDNVEDVLRQTRVASTMYFIEKMIIDFLSEIKKRGVEYNNLALDMGNSKILAWIELKNDDEKSEDNLIMAEAKVNAKYHDEGFHISTTIVEELDQITVPEHYHVIGQ